MITEIKQLNRYTLQLKYLDGKTIALKLKDIQEHCPCARCANKKRHVAEDVSAHAIKNVGRYALKIDFTSGCNHGIYSYKLLRNLGNEA